MINWIINHNKKYRQANLWSAAMQLREEQKKVIQMNNVTEDNNQFVEQQAEMLRSQHVVFAKAHNEDEAQKMQQIYAELENVPLLPVLAIA